MKRLTLIMLVAMIPFFTIAQKRSKKKVETTENSNSSHEFMVITGYEITATAARNIKSTDDMRAMESRVKIIFDFGGIRTEDAEKLSRQEYRSMAEAVNHAAKTGWEFVNANIVNIDEIKTHYYYMKRKK